MGKEMAVGCTVLGFYQILTKTAVDFQHFFPSLSLAISTFSDII